MVPGFGPMEMIVILVIALVVMGPKKLPDMGRSLGKGMREFKDSISGDDRDDRESLTAATATPEPTHDRATHAA